MSESQKHCASGSVPFLPAQPTFSLLFEVLVLIQEADVGLRTQRDVVLISSGLTATVLLFFLRSSLASSLQQLLELRSHQCSSESSPRLGRWGHSTGRVGARSLALSGKGIVCTKAHVCPKLRQVPQSLVCLRTATQSFPLPLTRPPVAPGKRPLTSSCRRCRNGT